MNKIDHRSTNAAFVDFAFNIPVAYCRIDIYGYIEDVNDACLKMFQVKDRDDVVGIHFSHFQPGLTKPEADRIIANLLAGATAGAGEFPIKAGDGTVKYLLLNVRPVMDQAKVIGLEGFIIDTTEFRCADEALRRNERNIAITLNSIGDAVIATDAAGFVSRMNPVAERLTGWPFADAKGRNLDEVFHIVNVFTRNPVESPVSRVLREKQVIGLANHTLLIARDGTERAIADSGAPITNENGEIEGVVLVFRDVSEAYAAERERYIKESAIADSISAILLADLDANVTYVNQAGWKTLGFNSHKDLVGKSLSVLLPNADEFTHLLELIRRGSGWTGNTRILGHNGMELDVFLSASCIKDEHGAQLCIMLGFADITEQKKTEAAVRERDLRLANLAAQIDGALVQIQQQPDGTFSLLYASQGISKVFGVTPEAAFRQTASIMRAIHSADVENVVQSFVRSAQELSVWACEFRMNIPAKGMRWIFGSLLPVRKEDGAIVWHGFFTDITDRKDAEAALEASERRFRSLFDNMSEGVALHILVRNEDGAVVNYRLLDANSSFEAHTGVLLDKALGRLATEAYGTSTPPFLQEYAQVAQTGRPHTFDSFFAPFNRHFHISAISPGPDQFATVFMDITDRVRMEEALRNAKDEADAANKAKSIFLANMSHELRTPLNPIIGFSSLLMEDATLNERQRRYLTIIRRRSEDLMTLLSDILDFTRIEGEHGALKQENVNLRDILADVMRSLMPTAQEKSLWWEWHVAPETPDFIHTDPLRLKQILMNLLSNALKFTVEGGISLEVGPAAEGNIRFVITDTGPGILPEDRAKIFDPFEQGSTAANNAMGGAGLGLSIVQRLVTRMGGTIEMNTEIGRGSTFLVTLPFSPPEAASAQLLPDDAVYNIIQKLGRGKRALVVDDDPSSWMLAASLLERAGFTVACAANGVEALRRFEEDAFDLVLMDIRMPGMNGPEVTAKIREIHPERHIPVVAVTAYAMPGDRERILEAGMDGYVVKPIRQAELFRAVETALAD